VVVIHTVGDILKSSLLLHQQASQPGASVVSKEESIHIISICIFETLGTVIYEDHAPSGLLHTIASFEESKCSAIRAKRRTGGLPLWHFGGGIGVLSDTDGAVKSP
jgi:hypothetical protein